MNGLLSGFGSLLTAATPLATSLGGAVIQNKAVAAQANLAARNAQVLAQQGANNRAAQMQQLVMIAVLGLGAAFAIKSLKA